MGDTTKLALPVEMFLVFCDKDGSAVRLDFPVGGQKGVTGRFSPSQLRALAESVRQALLNKADEQDATP